MPEDSAESIALRLQQLRTEHRDLDEVLSRLVSDHSVDELQIRRLKKRKLYLKDIIAKFESKMLPDIPA